MQCRPAGLGEPRENGPEIGGAAPGAPSTFCASARKTRELLQEKFSKTFCATLRAAVSSDTSSQGRKRRKFSKDGSVDGDSSQNSQGSLQKTLARETGRAYRLGQGGGRPV